MIARRAAWTLLLLAPCGVLATLASGCASHAPRQPPGAPGTPAAASELVSVHPAETFLDTYRSETGVPGVAAAVFVGGREVWSGGSGWANLEARTVPDGNTLFRLGSISKLLTAAVAGRLVDQGILDLDRATSELVSEYPDASLQSSPEKPFPAITIRQLLGHLGGVRHYNLYDVMNPRDQVRHPDSISALSMFSKDALVAEPGTRYSYTTYGYTLLAAFLERAAAEKFLDLVEREVLVPLDLRSTRPDRWEAVIEERAGFYDPNVEGVIQNSRHFDPSYKWAGGGYLASARDVARFGSAFFEPGYLKAETLATMFTSQKTAAGETTGTGLGWRIGKDAAGRTIWHHSGSQDGCRSVLLVYPEERLAIALLSNLGRIPQNILERVQILAAEFLPPL